MPCSSCADRKSLQDITPVTSIAHGPNVLVVHPSFPARTVPEFIAYARTNPGPTPGPIRARSTLHKGCTCESCSRFCHLEPLRIANNVDLQNNVRRRPRFRWIGMEPELLSGRFK